MHPLGKASDSSQQLKVKQKYKVFSYSTSLAVVALINAIVTVIK